MFSNKASLRKLLLIAATCPVEAVEKNKTKQKINSTVSNKVLPNTNTRTKIPGPFGYIDYMTSGLCFYGILDCVKEGILDIALRTQLYHSWAYSQKILQHVIRTLAPLCS